MSQRSVKRLRLWAVLMCLPASCSVRRSPARDQASTSTTACQKDDLRDCLDRCEKGSVASCTRAAAALMDAMKKAGRNTPTDVDAVRARALYLRACDGRDAEGCLRLGTLCDVGFGGTEDPAAAALAYERGCELSHPRACFLRGRLYLVVGPGVAHDPHRALHFFKKACAGGETEACEEANRMSHLP